MPVNLGPAPAVDRTDPYELATVVIHAGQLGTRDDSGHPRHPDEQLCVRLLCAEAAAGNGDAHRTLEWLASYAAEPLIAPVSIPDAIGRWIDDLVALGRMVKVLGQRARQPVAAVDVGVDKLLDMSWQEFADRQDGHPTPRPGAIDAASSTNPMARLDRLGAVTADAHIPDPTAGAADLAFSDQPMDPDTSAWLDAWQGDRT